MTLSKVVIITTTIFWLIVGGVVLRTNRLWFAPVTFSWHNLHQPSAMFRWTIAPTGPSVTLDPNSTRSFKIQVPKKFSTGTLAIMTSTDSGQLVVNINAPTGRTNITGNTADRHQILLPIAWDNIAVQTRTFNVDLLATTQAVTIAKISLTLRP